MDVNLTLRLSLISTLISEVSRDKPYPLYLEKKRQIMFCTANQLQKNNMHNYHIYLLHLLVSPLPSIASVAIATQKPYISLQFLSLERPSALGCIRLLDYSKIVSRATSLGWPPLVFLQYIGVGSRSQLLAWSSHLKKHISSWSSLKIIDG